MHNKNKNAYTKLLDQFEIFAAFFSWNPTLSCNHASLGFVVVCLFFHWSYPDPSEMFRATQTEGLIHIKTSNELHALIWFPLCSTHFQDLIQSNHQNPVILLLNNLTHAPSVNNPALGPSCLYPVLLFHQIWDTFNPAICVYVCSAALWLWLKALHKSACTYCIVLWMPFFSHIDIPIHGGKFGITTVIICLLKTLCD